MGLEVIILQRALIKSKGGLEGSKGQVLKALLRAVAQSTSQPASIPPEVIWAQEQRRSTRRTKGHNAYNASSTCSPAVMGVQGEVDDGVAADMVVEE